MRPHTSNIQPDDFFNQETKQKFLKIPHKVELVHPKIEIIDFDVPENGKYPLLRNIKMSRILKRLTEKDTSEFEVRKHLHGSSYSYSNIKTGLFICSNHGSHVENFIYELYKYDRDSGETLLNSYHDLATKCSDIVSIEERFIRQLSQLKEHLINVKFEIKEYEIDYANYLKMSEKEQIKFVKELYKEYGKGKRLSAYNDLDYTPFMNNGDLYIYDSSSARLYIVKNEVDSQKIYMIDRDRREIEMDDGMNEFAYSHQQGHLVLAKQINSSDLIGEIKDGKLIKASSTLTSFDLITSFIVKELYEKGKIVNVVPKLSFEELLDNYTLQKEFYQIKERAFLDIFKNIQLVDGILTYEDFSLMKETDTLKIKHEDFSIHTTRELTKDFKQNEKIKIKDLPQEYKDQINSYLNTLEKTYPNQKTEKICEYIRNEIKSTTKRLKM